MRIFRHIAGDAKGALAIEFAFVAPLFLLLLLVIVELGLTLTTQSLLDGATRDAARLIRTGQVQSQSSPITHIPDSAVLRYAAADVGLEMRQQCHFRSRDLQQFWFGQLYVVHAQQQPDRDRYAV